jgi:hypothetical protein
MRAKNLDSRLQTVAWGIIIILFGGLRLVPGDQTNLFVLGIGITLLGLNLLRYVNQIPVNGFSTALGIVTLILGGVASLRPMLGWKTHLELPLFPILLIVFGLYLLIPSPKQNGNG